MKHKMLFMDDSLCLNLTLFLLDMLYLLNSKAIYFQWYWELQWLQVR
jgi:hypothetical protein